MAGELQLSLFGKLQISRDGTPVTGFVSTKAQALLCYLAVTGRPHDRQTLATLLWGDMPEVEARTNLRTALANLRKLVEPHLLISREAISFNRSSPYWFDVEEFQTALTVAGVLLDKTQTSNTLSISASGEISDLFLPPLRQAVELYQGDFLEGFAVRDALEFEEWMFSQRERLRQLAVQALYTLAVQHTAQGEYAAGIDYTTRLLALEPWREEGHRQMMILLARSGQRSAALAQYDTCRQVLAEELGVEPMSETKALYERLKTADAPRPHNLPPQITPFVNRETEQAQISRYLDNPACRLLTLTGPGGIGKTRLALQVATQNLQLFQDGVFLISLATASSSEALVSNIASALNLIMSSPLEPKIQLLNYLRSKELLLILDNFEHLLSLAPQATRENKGGVGLLVELLQIAPRLKLLVTSRERLNLQEEWVLEIRGLTFPNRQSHPSSRQGRKQPASLAPIGKEVGRELDLTYYSAIALFIQQAQRIRADFALSAANQTDVIRLCQLVQGMPLGLELAATWLPVLSCGEIVAEIERDLDFLATSLRNVPDRHRSMRAVFESSWNLLSEVERGVLKQLSVFRGGFRSQAAIQVAGASLSLLLALLNKSLLRRNASGRYDMHELIQQYAAEKLAQSSGEQEETQARHCAYYAEFMQQRYEGLHSLQHSEALQEIGAEIENIQAAWRWAVEREQVKTISQLFWSLGYFYEARCWFHEAIEIFTKAAERLRVAGDRVTTPADMEKTVVYAQLLGELGLLSLLLARIEPAEAFLQQSLAILKPLQAQRELGWVLQSLGWAALWQGKYLQAKQYFEESVVMSRTCGHTLNTVASLSLLGCTAYMLGEYTQAEALLQENLPILRELDLVWWAAMLTYLAGIFSILGKLEEAKQLLQEGLTITRKTGDRWGVAICLSQLGVVFNLIGDAQRLEAKQLQQESVAIFREVGTSWGLAATLNKLGQTSCALGDYEEARLYLQEALQIASESQLTPLTLEALASLVDLRLRVEPGQSEGQVTALELLALIRNHPASDRVTKNRAARLLAEIETNLPGPVIEAARERGKTKPLETVIAEMIGTSKK